MAPSFEYFDRNGLFGIFGNSEWSIRPYHVQTQICWAFCRRIWTSRFAPNDSPVRDSDRLEKSHSQWHLLGSPIWLDASFSHRAKHGWQIYSVALNGASCNFGTNRVFCAGSVLRIDSCRSYIYAYWGLRSYFGGKVDVLCRNGRDQKCAPICNSALIGDPWWAGSRYFHIWWIFDRWRCDEIHGWLKSLFDALFNSLSHVIGRVQRLWGCQELPHGVQSWPRGGPDRVLVQVYCRRMSPIFWTECGAHGRSTLNSPCQCKAEIGQIWRRIKHVVTQAKR